jgi:hypothetical protein
MMLIGTSLGQCLRDILAGEVSESDVVMIITRTMAPDAERLIPVVEHYYYGSNGSGSYDLSVDGTKTLDEVKELAMRLFNTGKIHQPRCFPNFGGGYVHPGMAMGGKWIEIAPKTWNTTPAVLEAYDQYKMLDALTK